MKFDSQEQYSGRNGILIHELKGENNETANGVLGLFSEELNEDVLLVD